MKLDNPLDVNHLHESPSTRGAWIETFLLLAFDADSAASPSTRGAWIETLLAALLLPGPAVALHTGGVD